ncbi:hypothetical protein ABK046_08355 [Streptomyces caeruleatus]
MFGWRATGTHGPEDTHGDRRWTPAGVLLGLVSTLPAGVLALVAVVRPKAVAAPDRALWLRRLQSGHVGGDVAWVLVGTTVLGALTLPGMPGG